MLFPRNSFPQSGEAADWVLPCDDLAVDFGLNPQQIPEGAYSIAAGVDPRHDGQFRRPPGMTLWMDLSSCDLLRNEVFLPNSVADKPAWANSFWDAIPFMIYGGATLSTDTGRPETILGIVLWRPKPVWNSSEATLYIAWRDDQNYTSPVHSDAGISGTDSFGLVKVLYNADDPTPWWCPTPVSVASFGRILYIGRPYVDSPVAANGVSKPYLAGWFDHNPDPAYDIVTDEGWRWDFLGVPPRGQLYVNASETAAGGYTIVGNYRVAGRLVDTFRRRLSNATFLKADATDAEQDVPEQADTLAFAANAGYITADLVLVTGGYVSSEISTNRNRDFWNYWQVLTTLSSGATTTPGGGTFFVIDQMKTRDLWRDGSNGTVGSMRAFYNGDRDENTAPQQAPMVDRALGAQPAYDFEFDDFLDFEELGECHGMAFYKGGLVVAACVQPRKSDGTLAEIDGNISLLWSDTRYVAPENFPRPNSYPTKYRPQRQIPFGTTSETHLQENIYRPLVAFAEASNNLYVFGDGPIYRMVKSGTDMQVDELDQGLKPLNRNAVCSFGRGIIALTESGVWAIDGATGSIQKMRSLSRLLQDRWTAPDIRRHISCAYDSVMDTVYLLCPGTAEMVCLNLGTNRLTMESAANFTMVRQADMPSVSGAHLDKRALFFTWYGKIYYPEYIQPTRETSSEGSRFSRHDLREITTKDGTVVAEAAKAFHRVVGVQRITPHTHPVIRLTLSEKLLSSEGSDPSRISPLHGWGTTLGFLDGPLANKIFPTYLYHHAGAWGTNAYVDIVDEDTTRPLTDYADCRVTLSPSPMLLVGGPLSANRPHEYLQVRHVQATLPVLGRFQGGYSEISPYLPVIYAGVCKAKAIFDMEPATAPSEVALRPLGPYPHWIDLDESSVTLSPVPRDPNGTLVEYDEEEPWRAWASLNEGYGVTGAKLLPVFFCLPGGFAFDILEWYFFGRVEQSLLPS